MAVKWERNHPLLFGLRFKTTLRRGIELPSSSNIRLTVLPPQDKKDRVQLEPEGSNSPTQTVVLTGPDQINNHPMLQDFHILTPLFRFDIHATITSEPTLREKWKMRREVARITKPQKI
jgi:hypothetical protein